ncbi:MAG: hypothetical protein ACKO0M_02970 [Cyanobium sp.]
MEAHQIGRELRARVLSDRRQGRPLDPRLLQALIGDLCDAGQQELVAPLRYLVLSAAFSSAAGSDPPLADGRQLPRLRSELTQMYAEPLCARMLPLLEGLLGLPPSAAAAGSAAWSSGPAGWSGAPGSAGAGVAQPGGPGGTPPGAWGPAVSPMPPVGASPSRGGSPLLNALLAFLSGLLLMALAGMAVMLWQRQGAVVAPAGSSSGSSGDALPSAPGEAPTPAPAPPSSVPPPSVPAASELDSPSGSAEDRAVATIQQLYQALSAKNFSQAQGLYGSAAADQFDPGFFSQFERVTVQDLQVSSRVGSTQNLSGVVTFVWPDGSVQTESRTFSVDTGRDPAVITESEFGRVIAARR